MITNIKYLGLQDSKYPLYVKADEEYYSIGYRFNIGFGANGSSGKKQGLYEVTSAVNKQTFEITGEKQLGQALTERVKMKLTMMGQIIGALAAGHSNHTGVVEQAAFLAEEALKGEGL